jgi:phage FluMu protein Com
MEDFLFKEHRCKHCNKLLFKGVLKYGTVEIKCKNCKNINLFENNNCKFLALMDNQDSYKRSDGTIFKPAQFISYAISECEQCNKRNDCQRFLLIKNKNTQPF